MDHDADFFRPEPLDPDLSEYVQQTSFGQVLRHPLVYSVPYFPPLNRCLNRQLKSKREGLTAASNTMDWMTYLMLHERPWRATAFDTLSPQLTDPEYWNMLGWLWVDSENIPENVELWERFLRAGRTGSQHMMNDQERAALEALPDTLEIFQGHTDQRTDGWSYTTQKDTAVWFAHRFADLEQAKPMLTAGTVDKKRVHAYLLRRGEHEVLVDPDAVAVRTTRKIRPKPTHS